MCATCWTTARAARAPNAATTTQMKRRTNCSESTRTRSTTTNAAKPSVSTKLSVAVARSPAATTVMANPTMYATIQAHVPRHDERTSVIRAAQRRGRQKHEDDRGYRLPAGDAGREIRQEREQHEYGDERRDARRNEGGPERDDAEHSSQRRMRGLLHKGEDAADEERADAAREHCRAATSPREPWENDGSCRRTRPLRCERRAHGAGVTGASSSVCGASSRLVSPTPLPLPMSTSCRCRCGCPR